MGDSKVQNDSYFVVQGWMLNELGLSGTDLQVFAIIHGFSHAEENEFAGSIQYLCDFTGTSRPTIINSLKRLVELGYIAKRELTINGVTFNRYKVTCGGGKAALRGVKNLYGGSKESLHNNIVNNIVNTSTVNSRSIPSPKGAGTATKTSRRSLINKDELVSGLTKKQQTFFKQRCRLLVGFDFSDDLKSELEKYLLMLAQKNSLLPEATIREQLQMLCDFNASTVRKVQAVKSTVSHGWIHLKYALTDSGSSGNYNAARAANEIPEMAEAGRRSREARQFNISDYQEGEETF